MDLQERCNVTTVTTAFLDTVHLWTLEKLDLVSDHVITQLKTLLNLTHKLLQSVSSQTMSFVLVRKMYLNLLSVFVFFLHWTYLKMLSPKQSSFLCRLNGYIELSCPTFVISRPRPLRCRSTALGKRLRWDAAPPGGGPRQSRGCRVPAVERCRGARQERKWPGASKLQAGPEIIARRNPTFWGLVHQKSWLLLNVVVSLDLNFQTTITNEFAPAIRGK